MKILLCSDLHIDSGKDPEWYIDSSLFDIAFVCGDISNSAKETVRYLKKFKDKVIGGKPLYYVAGNHDRYNASFSESEYIFNSIPGFLNRKVIEYNGQRILGCTLWYKPSIYSDKNDWIDFLCIKDWKNILSEHEQDIKFLEQELQENDIVLTHMLPHDETISSYYKGNIYNKFFVTDLSKLISDRNPKLWCMGHSHDSMVKKINNTTFVRNPRGYPRENKNSFNMFIIDTDKLNEYDAISLINPVIKGP